MKKMGRIYFPRVALSWKKYDLDAIYRDLQTKERRSGQRVVPCPAKPERVSEQQVNTQG
jgi:hypothetical protein